MKLRMLFLLPIGAILLTGCGFSLAGDVTPPPGYTPPLSVALEATSSVFPVLPPDPERGRSIYQQECAACHGSDGRGDGVQSGNLPRPPQILSDPSLISGTSPAQLFQIITNGIPENNMPAYQSVLDDRARWDVTSYLYLMSSDADSLASGKLIFDGLCAGCHGLTGKGDGEDARGLRLQPPDFTNQSILSPRTNRELFQIVTGGSGEVMPSFGKSLTEEERLNVVQYIRALSFLEVVIPTTTPALTVVSTPAEDQAQTPSAESEVIGEAIPTTPEAVTISGKVIHDLGGSLPPALEVTLHIFDRMTETKSRKTQTTGDGTFAFEPVEMKEGRIFITSVEYDNRVFNSQPSFHPELLSEGEDFIQSESISLDLHISNSTTDLSSLTADRMHLFIDFPKEGMMQVVELFLISNNGSEVVVPPVDGDGGLVFLLPEGATNLQFDDSTLGEKYLPVDNGFVDTSPILPGQSTHQILFAYDLPYEKKATLTVPVPLKTGSISVMVPEGGIKLKSSQLLDGGVRSSQQMSFQVFNGSDFAAGSQLSLSLTGSPNPEAAPQKLSINPILFGSGFLVLALTGILYYYFWRKERSVAPMSDSDQVSNKEAIMDAILSLDEQFKAGNLNEQVYQQRRTELKDQLRKSM